MRAHEAPITALKVFSDKTFSTSGSSSPPTHQVAGVTVTHSTVASAPTSESADKRPLRHGPWSASPPTATKTTICTAVDTDTMAAAYADGSHARPAGVTLTEAGPRFQMRPFLIKLGTLDQESAEVEWVLKAFTNTARKRAVL